MLPSPQFLNEMQGGIEGWVDLGLNAVCRCYCV